MKLYGSLQNRLEENKMFTDEIKVGTGMTEYLYSDTHAYEVTAVKDQKHVTVRRLDHKHVGDGCMDNNWELISNPENPEYDLVKRGNYWYSVQTITPELAQEIMDEDDIQRKLWAGMNGFDLKEIIETGKTKKSYNRWNVSFGVAQYYYDYSF